jgi:short-subunit dehydrogenase
MKNFKKALITGASSGIGEALARLLAKQGIALILTGRNRDHLERLKTELETQVSVETIAADLERPTDRAIVLAKIREAVPDLVVNNAGVGLYGDAVQESKEKQMSILSLNVEALTELTLEAARALTQANAPGIILNVSSVAAFLVFPKFAVYSASKAYVNQFSESLDWELKSKGIRVLATCPGVVATHFRDRAGGKEPSRKELRQAMTSDFAAEQIWWQIKRERPLYVFDWKYRVMAFLTRTLLPKALVAKIVDQMIKETKA